MAARSDPALDPLRARVVALAPRLGKVGREATLAFDNARNGDFDGAAAKARKVVEGTLQQVGKRRNVRVDGLGIEQLRPKLKDHVPAEIWHQVDLVQRFGNHGAHSRDTDLRPGAARTSLSAMTDILDWYVATWPPPRRRGRSLLLAAFGMVAAAGVGFAVVAAGALLWESQPEPVVVEATTGSGVAASVAEVAPAEPVPAMPTAAVVVPRVHPLTPRALAWLETGQAAAFDVATRACTTDVADLHAEKAVAGWTPVRATCAGRPVEGWLPTESLPADVARVEPSKPSSFGRNRVEELLREGDTALEDERWQAAADAYGRGLDFVADDPHLLDGRGYARLRMGEYPEALGDFALCLSAAPEDADCRAHAAQAECALHVPGCEADLPAEVPEGAIVHAVTTVDTTLMAPKPRRKQAPSKRALCPVAAGTPVEKLSADEDWVKVRTTCAGHDAVGFLPLRVEGRDTIAER